MLGGVLQICTLGQPLCAVEYFASADACSPYAHVVGVLQLGEVGLETMLVQVVYLLLSAQVAVTCECDDLHTGSHYQEGHIEADLVVACACAAMCNGACAYLLGIACDGERLEDALRTDADGVAVVPQHVAEDHILERLLVVLLRYIQGDILGGAQSVGVLFVGLQLFGAEAAGVGACCIHLVTFLLGQVHHCVAGVEAATEGNHHFLLLLFHNARSPPFSPLCGSGCHATIGLHVGLFYC